MAIGFKNCACLLFSKSNGVRPATVVAEVKNIALNREFPALRRPSLKEKPFLKLLLNFPIRTRPSLTIIPISAIIPNKDSIFTGKS